MGLSDPKRSNRRPGESLKRLVCQNDGLNPTTDLIDEYIKACIRNALWHTMAALALLDDVANRRIRRGRNFKDQQDPLA